MDEKASKQVHSSRGFPGRTAGHVALGSVLAFVLVGFALWIGCAEEPVSPSAPAFQPTYFLESVSASPGQVGVGGGSSVISARVVNDDGEPAAGVSVGFDADEWGSVTSLALTDSTGVARATFTSGHNEGLGKVTAHVEAFSKSTVILIGQGSLEARPSILLANGEEQSVITAQVVSATGRADSGSVVVFETTAGSITPRGVTDAAGTVTATLTSGASVEDISAVVTARVMGSEENSEPFGLTMVTFKGITLEVDASPSAIPADGSTQAELTAVLKETSSLVPISGEFVRFATNRGVTVGEIQTDERGHAVGELTSSLQPGTARVIASYGNTLSDTVEVVFSSLSLTLSATPPSLPGDGVSQLQVGVVLKDLSGEVLSYRVIEFATAMGTVTDRDTTGISGGASAIFTAPVSAVDTTVSVTATALGVTAEIDIPIRGLHMTVAAEPETLVADGSSQSQVTVTLVETTSGEPIRSESIRLAANLGTVDSVAVTNSGGVAAATFHGGSKTGSATITATYGGGLVSTSRIEIVSAEVASVALSCLPGAIVADGFSKAQVQAVVKDGGNRSVPDGLIVKFYTSSGLITAQSTTEEGIARALLTSDTEVQSNVRVIAVCEAVADTAYVDFIPGMPATIALAVWPDSIPADGTTTASLMATVQDSVGHPVRDGTLVIFQVVVDLVDTTGADTVVVSSTTDEGVAATSYTAATRAGLAVITATSGEATDQATLVLTASGVASIVLTTNRSSITVRGVGGVETATITAEVRDKNGNPVAQGTEVEFSIISGPGGPGEENLNNQGWGPVPIPSANGRASVTLSAGTCSGVVSIQASCGGILASDGEVTIDSGPPDKVALSLDLNEHVYNGDGTFSLIVSALLDDVYGNPVENGTAVYFHLDPNPLQALIEGSGVTGNEALCNQTWTVPQVKGLAHTCLSYTSADVFEDAGIWAEAVQGANRVVDSLVVTLPIIEGTLAMWANPTYVYFAACDSVGCPPQSTYVTAVLTDKYNRRIEGGVVDFMSDSWRATCIPPTAVTDAAGRVSTTVVVAAGPADILTITAVLRETGVQAPVEITLQTDE